MRVDLRSSQATDGTDGKQGQAGNPKTQAKRILAEWKSAGFFSHVQQSSSCGSGCGRLLRTVHAPDIALPPLVPALHRAPSAHPPHGPRPPPRTVRAPDIALPPLVPALHRAPSAHPISRSRPLSPPFTAHRPRIRYRAPAPALHPISRSRPLSPPSTAHRPRTRYRALAPCPRYIALPPLVPALHRAPSAHPISRSRPLIVPALHRALSAQPISRSRPLSPPSTAHRPRTRYRAGPPRTVRTPDIALPPLVPALHDGAPDIALPPLVPALHRAPSAHPISRSRPLSPPSTAHRPRTRYRAPAPCPRPPPRTVRAPDIALPPLVPALHRAPSAHPISRSRPLSPPSTAHRPRTRYAHPNRPRTRYQGPCTVWSSKALPSKKGPISRTSRWSTKREPNPRGVFGKNPPGERHLKQRPLSSSSPSLSYVSSS